MNRWILTHARLAFWLWTVPSLALLVWYAARNEGEGLMTAYALFVLWEAAGFWGINGFLCGWARRPAFRAMDEYCDPEPLLELCRMVLKQNPKSLFYRVFEGYALALLGRRREAEDSAHMAAEQPRLWKNPPLLAVWLTQLPPEDPERERGELAHGTAGPPGSLPKSGLSWPGPGQRDRAAQIQEARPELEPLLLADLEQAGCTREQVAGPHGAGDLLPAPGVGEQGPGASVLCGCPRGTAGSPYGGGADAVPPIRKGLRQAGDNVLPVRLGFLPFG